MYQPLKCPYSYFSKALEFYLRVLFPVSILECPARWKFVKRCFGRIREGWAEKVVPFTVHSMSNKSICSFNKQRRNPIWSHSWTQMKQKLRVMNPPNPLCIMCSGNILDGGNLCFRVFKLQLKVINKKNFCL